MDLRSKEVRMLGLGGTVGSLVVAEGAMVFVSIAFLWWRRNMKNEESAESKKENIV